MNDFGLGLQVTAWGMGLVFGTLIIVAVVIWALDKVFRPKPEAEEEGDDQPPTLEAEAAPPPVGPSRSNEAAAIGVALALELQRAARPSVAPAATLAQPFLAPLSDEDVTGEVVTVATFDAGPGLWKGHGRMTSTI